LLHTRYARIRPLHSSPTRRSSDLIGDVGAYAEHLDAAHLASLRQEIRYATARAARRQLLLQLFELTLQPLLLAHELFDLFQQARDRKSTRLNSSHVKISYAVFCLN